MNDGVLVSREWLERVNDTLFGNTTGKAEKRGASSLFYDLRPAVLASAWTQGSDGVYKATAKFITQTGVASTDAYPVYAPTATANPGGTVDATRFNIAWRGRWEMIAGAGKMTYAQIKEALQVQEETIVYVESVSIANGALTFSTASKKVLVSKFP